MDGRSIGRLLVFLLIGTSAGVAGAEDRIAGTVSGQGVVTLRPSPTALRMRVQLCAYGRTVTLALDRLKTRRQTALERLRELEADKESIWVANPAVSEHTPPRARALAPVPDVPPGRAPRPAPEVAVGAAESPESPHERPPARRAARPRRALGRLFAACQVLSADWPLVPGNLDSLLASAHGIQDRVKAADLGGGDYARGLTVEEREMVEETLIVATPAGPYAAAPYSPGPQRAEPPAACRVPPGEPRFVYVATIPPCRRKQALAESFAQAKAQATDLAEAAGTRLGPLVELSGRVSAGVLPADEAPAQGAACRTVAPNAPVGPNCPETTAAAPNALYFTFPVTARFRLE